MKFACLTLAFTALCTIISKESHILSKPQIGISSPALPVEQAAGPEPEDSQEQAAGEEQAPQVQAPARAPQTNPLPHNVVDPMIRQAANKHKVKASLVKGIVMAESAFNANAKSSKGALGLMQLMPETAQEYGADPMDPAQNIEAGTRYLRVLFTRYGKYRNCMARVIAAYNAGPGNVDKYRGIPPFRETRCYVQKVMAYMRQFERDPS
jgi:soluble lytic murein transglycosylase-like protein